MLLAQWHSTCERWGQSVFTPGSTHQRQQQLGAEEVSQYLPILRVLVNTVFHIGKILTQLIIQFLPYTKGDSLQGQLH